jgi:fatty-acyl-CoA synthase
MNPSIVHGPGLKADPRFETLTMAAFVRAMTERHAEREAVVWRGADAVIRWSYADLWQHSVEVAKSLIATGVGKDSRVGLLMTNRPELLAALFGVALAGGVVVMLSTFSAAPELEYLLQASAVSHLIFERHIASRDLASMLTTLEPAVESASPGQLLSARFPFLRRLVMADETSNRGPARGLEGWHEFQAQGLAVPLTSVTARAASATAADVGLILFSSGTTGVPKGIIHSQRAVVLQWLRWAELYHYEDGVRSWTANGFFWSGPFSMILGTTLSCGGCLVLQSTFSPEEALDLMQTERVVLPMASGHQWARMAEAPNFQSVNLSSLHYIDEFVPVGKQPTLQSSWRLPQGFGTTETLSISTAVPISTPLEARRGHGVPLAGNVLKVIDRATGEVVPRGERGEIALKGPTLMLRYIGKNAEDTFDAEGFYRTGDGGYVDQDGGLFWEGRLSDLIKTGGANVAPAEVDAAIATYPGVKLTQTVGVPHAALGEIVVACIVPHEGMVIDAAALREHLKARLASYKIPRQVLFLRHEELSLTGSSKVKADVLRRLVVDKMRTEPT